MPNQVDWLLDIDSITDRTDVFSYYNQTFMTQLESSVNVLNYTNAQLLNIRWGLMYMDSFAKNPTLQRKISSLGYVSSKIFIEFNQLIFNFLFRYSQKNFTVFSMFHKFYSRLFKLAPDLNARYNEFTSHIKKSSLICVQIRLGVDDDFSFTPRSHVPKFWNFINSTFIQSGLVGKNWKIYVTSDHEFVRDEALSVFGADRVFFYRNSSVHIEMLYRKVKFKNEDVIKFQNVVLDFHTLQNCKYAVLSHSGFGILGVMNRPESDKNVWVYTSPETMKVNYWSRDNFRFVKIEPEYRNFNFL